MDGGCSDGAAKPPSVRLRPPIQKERLLSRLIRSDGGRRSSPSSTRCAGTGQEKTVMKLPHARWHYFHYALVFFLLFGLGHLSPPAGLTPPGMRLAGIFAGVIYGWITLSIGWPSVLGLVALGTSGYTGMGELLALAFGSQTMIMILTLLLLAAFVQQADLTELILRVLLTRKSARGRPFLILFHFLLAGFIASVLSHCLAVLILFLELFKEMMKKSGIRPYSGAVPCFFVGMAYAFVLGDIALPFKSTAIVGIGAYEALTGSSMNLMRYAAYMFPLCVLCIASYVLCCKYVFRIDLSALSAFEQAPVPTGPLPVRKKAALAAVLVAMSLLLLPGVVPLSWTLSAWLADLGLGGLSLLILSALLMIRVEGQPLLDLTRVAPYFSWNVFFVLAFLLPMATALSSDAAGLKHILAMGASSLLAGLPGLALLFAIVLLAALVTNFSNNLVVCGIFVSIACFMGDIIPFPAPLVTCLIILGSSIALFFPAASPLNAVLFSQKDLVTFRQQFSLGLGTSVLQCALISVFGYLWGIVIF